MSPEIHAGEAYTLKSDIWSLGCVIYELCQKKQPFNGKTPPQLAQSVRKGNFPPLPDIYSADLKTVVAGCLQANPSNRPETASLINMPFIRLILREREIMNREKEQSYSIIVRGPKPGLTLKTFLWTKVGHPRLVALAPAALSIM
jgi:serine/threonine protein kinase